MRLNPADIEWLCVVSDVPAKCLKAVTLAYVDGYMDSAIAAELKITAGTVRVYRSLFRTCILAAMDEQRIHEDDAPRVSDALESMDSYDAGDELESDHLHACRLLDAMNGPEPAQPFPASYDVNGRRVASRGPLVSADDATRLVKALRLERERRAGVK